MYLPWRVPALSLRCRQATWVQAAGPGLEVGEIQVEGIRVLEAVRGPLAARLGAG